ncbi:MAG: family 16 glycosylhydrolase [Bacteroidales bacterium]|nr:family 16 glycosylhydrolase [Bacteroidales bacterium]
MNVLIPVLFAIAASGCGGKEAPVADNQQNNVSVSVTPESLSCPAQESVLTLDVNASAAFQTLVQDGVDWVKVDPSYSAEPQAQVTVKVSENLSFKERSAEITIKSGTVRKKVSLTQDAAQKGETSIDIPDGYHLVWQDEFNSGDKPSADWWYETGGGGWGNNEIQTYVAQAQGGVDLAYISDGSLKIKADEIGGKVYSIRMNTKKYWTYGWFEARIKVSDVPGSWPAFWMMPQNYTTWPGDGEIDIMEYAISTQGKNYSSSSIHCNAFNHMKGTQKTHKQFVADAAKEYHVYACEWTSEWMKFYIDGKQHLQVNNDGQGYDHWPFYTPFYLKLNLAWGGNMGGSVDASQLPAIYEIDYVRVFQKD